MEKHKEAKDDLFEDSRERRRFEQRRKELKEIEEWTKQTNEWHGRCMIWKETKQEEETSVRFRELEEGSKRNEKLMAKLLKTLKILNGEEGETGREDTKEKWSSEGGGEKDRTKRKERRESETNKKREEIKTACLDKPPQPLRITLADIAES